MSTYCSSIRNRTQEQRPVGQDVGVVPGAPNPGPGMSTSHTPGNSKTHYLGGLWKFNYLSMIGYIIDH